MATSYLLFLLMLLLTAPLLVISQLWRARKSVRDSVKLVSTFTVGHSITLLIGAVRGAVLPAQMVELLFAISIVISALHALHPILAGREVCIAAAFGLAHGLVFASSLRALVSTQARLCSHSSASISGSKPRSWLWSCW